MKEEYMRNVDETHIVLDFNDGHKIATEIDKKMKFADVLHRNMSITMMVLLGGSPNVLVNVPMLLFENAAPT